MKSSRCAVLAAVLLLLRPPGSVAQSALLWDTSGSGGAQGGTGNWLGANNWNNIIPGNNVAWSAGSLAVFGATPGTVTVNGAVAASGLIFNVNGYTVSGASTLTLNGAPPSINVSNAGQSAVISAPLGGSVGFTKIGAGALTLSGSAASSYTGLATVNEGTLNLSKSGVNALTGNLTIGDGSGAAASAIVVEGFSNQIPDTATVRIEQDGFWNLASGNRSETIGGLVLGESSVATGTGTLTVNGDVSTFRPADDGNYPTATISGLVNLGGATRAFTTVVIGENGADLIVFAAISNGGLTKAGRNDLELSGTAANTYTGVTTVTGPFSKLVLNKTVGVNAISGDLSITDAAEVRQSAGDQIADTATVTVDGGEWDFFPHSETIATLRLTGGRVSGRLALHGNVTATSTLVTASSIGGTLDLGGATRVLDVALGPYSRDLNLTAVVSNGGLTKIGAGHLNLFNTNSFLGPVAIKGGVVSVELVQNSGVSSNLGAGNSISFDGGRLDVTLGTSSATNRAVTLNAGGGTVGVSSNLGTVTLTGASTGAGGLTKTGPGTLTLGGTPANVHAGTTTATDGALTLNKPASVDAFGGDLAIGDGSGTAASTIVTQGADEQVPDSATVAIAADGFWNLASGNRSETIAALAMTAGSIATGIGTLTVNGTVATHANAASASISGQLNLDGVTRTFDVAEGAAALDLDIFSAISNGAGGLTKTGDGTLRLSGANVFSGPVAVNAGTLIARNGSAIGDGSDVTVVSVAGATLSIDGDEMIGSLAGGGSVVPGTASTLNVGGGSSTTFSGSISGAGGLTKSGAGTLTLSGAPTYAGNTLITAGTLALNSGIASAVGTMTVSAPGTLQARTTVNRAIAGDGIITATGTLVIGDASSASGFAFNGTLNAGSNAITLADADAAQLGVATTLGANGRLDSFNGIILAGGRSVTVAPAISASISGSLTNNGTVNGPTLSGQSLTFLGAVNGAGNCTGNVVFTGGYSPGNGPASVTLENVTFGAANTLALELGGTTPGLGCDHVNVTGTTAWGGSLVIELINGFTPAAGDAFDVFDFDAARDAGTFSSITLPSLTAGLTWDTSQLYTTGTLTVIPAGLTFSQWAATSGIPGALPGGDHDNDGYDNAAEFALGLFPPQPGTVEPTGGFHTYGDGERLRVLLTRPLDRTGVTVTLQGSADLLIWTDLATSVNSAVFTGPGFVSENRAHPLPDPGLVEVRDILTTSTAQRRQMRLKVMLTP